MDEETASELANKILEWLSQNTWELEFNDEEAAQTEIKKILMQPRWAPVDTAPKDGTVVDLWVFAEGFDRGSRAVEYHWDETKADWVDDGRRLLADAYLHSGVRATHWLLTPIAPKS